jgi:hypothetical protein
MITSSRPLPTINAASSSQSTAGYGWHFSTAGWNTRAHRAHDASARGFSYADAHRAPLGVNYKQIPVNSPKSEVHSYSKDGAMRIAMHPTLCTPVTSRPISARWAISAHDASAPTLEVVDVALFGRQHRPSVGEAAHCGPVEMIGPENDVGADLLGMDDGGPPSRVMRCPPGDNWTPMRIGLVIVRTP